MHNSTIPPDYSQIDFAGEGCQSSQSQAAGLPLVGGLSSLHISPLPSPVVLFPGSFVVLDQDGVVVPPRDEPEPGNAIGKITSPHVVFYKGGSLATVKRLKVSPPMKAIRARRQEITHFSSGSRRRLLRTLARTRRDTLPIFVTLTYPGVYSSSPADWKRDLDVFGKRFCRRWPGAAFVWRLEFQKRGAPHYHLLVWGVDYKSLLEWVGLAWFEVVNSGDEKHLKAGTRVELLRSWKGAFAYASKYLAKRDTENITGVGRFWGVIARAMLPWAEEVNVELSERQAVTLLRWLRRYAGLPGRDFPALSVFCDASQWIRVINQLE